ncbi:FtsX-like permease family protein [Candidatus Saccharibacteria bacterium]|nr:MAG: FtsX-like permease family protein [Candidatus Saccharibacteria bacterium]
MNGMKRGVKNAFRNKIRTVSIILILGLSMGLALSMMIANQAVTQKIETVKSSVGNTVSISPAGARGFEGGGEPLTTESVAKVSSLDHVTSVTIALSDRVTSDNSDLESAVDAGSLGRRNKNNSGQGFQFTPPQGAMGGNSGSSDQGQVTRTFTPPVTVVGTNEPSKLATSEGSSSTTLELTSGELFDGSTAENVALVGKQLAEKNELSVGSTFTLYGQSIKVVGIFDTGTTFSNNQVIMPVETLQTLSSQANQYTSVTLTVDSIENVASVTSAAKSALGDAADVTNGSEQAESTIAPLKNIQTISTYSLIAAVGAGAVIIFLTMIMIVRERRREIGVLKAIGASNVKVALQFMAEAVTFTLLATVIGFVIAAFAAQPLTSVLATSSTSSTTGGGMGGPGGMRGGFQALNSVRDLTAQLDWSIILYGLGAAILIAVIGSLLASIFIAKVRPAEVMRAE